MAIIDITSVERIDSAARHLIAWGIDRPQPSSMDGYFLAVAGWVAGRDCTVEGVTVRFSDGAFVTCGSVFLVRPDVTEHLQLAKDVLTGFDFALNVISLPTAFKITLEANLREDIGGNGIPIAVIRGTHSRPCTSFRPSLQPLSLTSLGRTGTTLLMQMLAVHPAVVAQRVFPYETRIAGWWMHSLAVLAGHANRAMSSHPDTFLDDKYLFWTGSNPWALDNDVNGPALRAWLRGDAVEDIAAFCQRQIDEAYRRIARDQNQEESRFFIEKTVPTRIPRMLWQLYDGTREIFLVRDFRDMFCSMTAFDAKRNQHDFQRGDADMDVFLARLVRDFRWLVSNWEERCESALLVRYEDLVGATEETLRDIAEYVGIDSSPASLTSMIAAADAEPDQVLAHRTTATWKQSINRYRREMSPALRERSLELGGDLLTKLGYDAEGS
jgi:hypothetical protein